MASGRLLIGGNRDSHCRTLLYSASNSLNQIITRIRRGGDALDLGSEDRNKLKRVLDDSAPRIEKPRQSRSALKALFEFDQALQELGQNSGEIFGIIGTLMIMSEEFASLISQSVRHLNSSAASTNEIDLGSGAVKVPGAFGAIQEFKVEVDAMYPADKRSIEILTVGYTTVLLAALKACLRSFLLWNSLDSESLFLAFEKLRFSETVLFI